MLSFKFLNFKILANKNLSDDIYENSNILNLSAFYCIDFYPRLV